jgi:hypothetical protein
MMTEEDPQRPIHPIDGQVVLMAGAKASVAPSRLPTLLARAQTALNGRRETYTRRFECVVETEDRLVLLAPEGFWVDVCDRVGLDRREREAVVRAHEEQVLRVGRREGRKTELEAALELRDAVVYSRDR